MNLAISGGRRFAPGLGLAIAITLIALGLAALQERLFDYAVLEPLVLALILGLVIRATVPLPARVTPGISFSAKQLLEAGIVILGATLNLGSIAEAGPRLAVAVLVSVSTTLVVGITLGRAAGLSTRLAVLVAVGNAICGNSAIAAVAPAIRARKQDVASAIALTAVLGVGVVLLLPSLIGVFSLSDERYGVVAGLSVYAVPQVLAATIPVSAEAGQFGSLVKLTRVLLLGPVVALFAIAFRNRSDDSGGADVASSTRRTIWTYLPWFVVGFLLMAVLRTSSVIPDRGADIARELSRVLTAIAMAGLGLSVDIRAVQSTGGRVLGVVLGLTVLLVTMALLLTSIFAIG